MMAALYPNHPYGIPIIGWEHEIEKLDRDDALAFYKRFYAPNNALLVVAGDVEPDEVKRLAEETYGKIAGQAALNGRSRPKEPEHYAPVRVELEDPTRRPHHGAALLSRAELRLGRAGRGRGAGSADAHRRAGSIEQAL